MARFMCPNPKCRHNLRMRHRKSEGQKIYCPKCGELVYEYVKPLHPPKATQVRKSTLDEHEDRR